LTGIGLKGKAAIRNIWKRSDLSTYKKDLNKQLMRMVFYCYALHPYKFKYDEEAIVSIYPNECI
jgi:hypothetical protein